MLRVIGDPDSGKVTSDADPFVGIGIFQVRGNFRAHKSRFSQDWFLYDRSWKSLAAHFNFKRTARAGKAGRNVAHADSNAERRTLGAAYHFADFFATWFS